MYKRNCRKCCMCENNMTQNQYTNYEVFTNALESYDDDCECGFNRPESMFPENAVLAQSYVPIQKMSKTYTPNKGLKKGTIFPELVRPYEPCQSMEEIAFIKAMNDIGEGCNEC